MSGAFPPSAGPCGHVRDDAVVTLRDMGAKVAFLGAELPVEPETEVRGVLISSVALRSDAGGNFVWRVSAGRVERREITLGSAADRDRVLVLDGLQPGDTVVTSAEAPLAPGRQIETN